FLSSLVSLVGFLLLFSLLFFFTDPPTSEIYTLSLHDALPIWQTLGNKPLIFGGGSADTSDSESLAGVEFVNGTRPGNQAVVDIADRKSTRLNSSHVSISYAVFCLKKKKKVKIRRTGTST